MIVAVVGLYYWKVISDDRASKEICAQVVTFAKDPRSSQCRQYSTTCDVPLGWQVVPSCVISTPSPTPADTSNWNVYKGVGLNFSFKYPADWKFDLKNTSAKYFGQLTFMHVLEFDTVNSTRKDPYGMLLGRFEVIYLTSGDFKDKTLDDFVADNFEHAQPTNTDVMIGRLKVKRVNHLNCAWNKDCVDLVFKVGNTFFDIRPLVLETKEQDLQLLYTILGTFESPDLESQQ